MSALALFMGAFLAVFMVLGAGFTAVMLAVTGNRMFTEFAGTFRTIADTFTVNHGSDSSCVVASAQMHTVSVGAAAGCDLLTFQCLRSHSINNANNSDCEPTSSFKYKFLRFIRTVSGEMFIWLAVEITRKNYVQDSNFKSADAGINTVPQRPAAAAPPLKMNCGPAPRRIACAPAATASQGEAQPG